MQVQSIPRSCITSRVAVALAGTIFLSSPVGAQLPQTHHDDEDGRASFSSDLVAGATRAFLERPLPLDEEVTRVRHSVEGTDPATIARYEQGLTFQYLYHYLNAIRSFNEAIRMDSTFLPAYAGLSRALVSHGAREEAETVIQRASELLTQQGDEADPIGRLLVELRVQALAANSDEDREAYRDRLDETIQSYPDDAELRMIRALNTGDSERIDRMYEVLGLQPDHVGARHELVHTFERRRDYDRAVGHGGVLSDLAPSVAHARHMHGHNLMRVGRVSDAFQEFISADSIERAYFEREGIPEYFDWHHPHNLHLLALTQWHLENVSAAEQTLRQRAAVPNRQGRTAPARLLQLGELMVAEGRGEAALEIARNIRTFQGVPDLPTGIAIQAYLLEVEGHLLQGDIGAAGEAYARAQDLRGGEGDGGFMVQRWVSRVDLQLLLHQGRVAEVDESLTEVLVDLRRDRGPDGWITSLLHLHALGWSAYAAGEGGVARRVVDAMRDHDPTFRVRIPGFEG